MRTNITVKITHFASSHLRIYPLTHIITIISIRTYVVANYLDFVRHGIASKLITMIKPTDLKPSKHVGYRNVCCPRRQLK